jgi:hypothetical protein
MRRASSSATLPALPLMRKPLSVGESGALMGKRHSESLAICCAARGQDCALIWFGLQTYA